MGSALAPAGGDKLAAGFELLILLLLVCLSKTNPDVMKVSTAHVGRRRPRDDEAT
jgi:hypothetical protein